MSWRKRILGLSYQVRLSPVRGLVRCPCVYKVQDARKCLARHVLLSLRRSLDSGPCFSLLFIGNALPFQFHDLDHVLVLVDHYDVAEIGNYTHNSSLCHAGIIKQR
jgi:hypothetical protein